MSKLQIITGGTSGMGLATAKAVSKYGPVLIGGRNEARLETALDTLKDAGIQCYGKTCDVSQMESIQDFAAYGASIAPIGNVINAAGVDFDNATIEQIVQINMKGTINVVEGFFPYLEDSAVVNYSSITGYFYTPKPEEIEVWSNPEAEDFCERCIGLIDVSDKSLARLGEAYPAYCASKRFVMYYTMANALRFGKKNNRIFSIAPGSFDTPMLATQAAFMDSIIKGTAFQRVGSPEEMAQLIANLLDPKVQYLTGCDIIMDGGKFAMATVKQLK